MRTRYWPIPATTSEVAIHGGRVCRPARAYYGQKGRLARIGLNRAMRRAVTLLREYPEAGKPAGRTAREFVIDTYPYSLIYHIEDEAVVISALYHHSRDPKFWHERFGPER